MLQKYEIRVLFCGLVTMCWLLFVDLTQVIIAVVVVAGLLLIILVIAVVVYKFAKIKKLSGR